MRHSSSGPASSSSSASYSSSLSITSVVQYGFLAALAYILAGAPLSTLLTSHAGGDVTSSSSVGARSGVDVRANLDNLVIPERNLSCAAHTYKGVYVLSREPLVVYIEGFVSEEEEEEVVALRYVCSWLHTQAMGRDSINMRHTLDQ
jgi:prolyl 4-hydroxylase